MFDLNKYPRLRINKQLQSVRVIVLLRRQPLKRFVIFIRRPWPFVYMSIWFDPRKVLKNFCEYINRQNSYATDAKSKYYAAINGHPNEFGYMTPPEEAYMHFALGSHGKEEFARRFTYWREPINKRIAVYFSIKTHNIRRMSKRMIDSLFVKTKKA